MTFNPSPELYAKMREAVVQGRRMRDLQNLYFRGKSTSRLMAAQEAERKFDALTLAAVRLEQHEQERIEP